MPIPFEKKVKDLLALASADLRIGALEHKEGLFFEWRMKNNPTVSEGAAFNTEFGVLICILTAQDGWKFGISKTHKFLDPKWTGQDIEKIQDEIIKESFNYV